mgnify:CR=1 FL=1
MAKSRKGTKLYYSISEVAEITDLQPYTLRAWEKEFSCLRPRRARGKNRAYRERDIGIVQLIKRLLYEEGYTTKGVKQKLKNEPNLLQLITFTSPRVDPRKVVEGSLLGSIIPSNEEKVQVNSVSVKMSHKKSEGKVECEQNAYAIPLVSKTEKPNAISKIKKELREILELL